MPGVGFIRVKLLQCDCPSNRDETFDPYVAVNVKEAVNTPGLFVLFSVKDLVDKELIFLCIYKITKKSYQSQRCFIRMLAIMVALMF